MFLLVCVLSAACSASAGVNAGLREGGKLYENQKYGQALARYNEILKESPQNEAASFGAGAAAYYLKDYASAEAAFRQAARQEGELEQNALFNLGNAYYRAGDKQKAIQSYRQAILKNPKDKEAVHNLQIVLQEQQNQNSQNNQNDQNQDQNSPNQSGGGQQDSQGDSDSQNGQEQSNSQEDRDAARRVMQMARDNEYKQPASAGAAQDNTVEKDW